LGKAASQLSSTKPKNEQTTTKENSQLHLTSLGPAPKLFFERCFPSLWSIWCDNIRHRPPLGRVLSVKYTPRIDPVI
jgi:hypothetical protein